MIFGERHGYKRYLSLKEGKYEFICQKKRSKQIRLTANRDYWWLIKRWYVKMYLSPRLTRGRKRTAPINQIFIQAVLTYPPL
ncbi:MAG: hypothetical protein EGQ00_05380 [Parabacteroides johnsonii]|nr:hypothetical protein [Parabacteroides johnsonii]